MGNKCPNFSSWSGWETRNGSGFDKAIGKNKLCSFPLQAILNLDFLSTVPVYIKNPKQTNEKCERDDEKRRRGCYSHSNIRLVFVLEKKVFFNTA